MKASVVILILVLGLCIARCSVEEKVDSKEPAAFVDPFIGTGGHGHTFPGASMPFGMVQLSPNSRLDGWDGVSGYHYTDSLIYGFTHTALSGTGVGDYCDILIMPMVGEPSFNNAEYRSPFRKSNERAEAGYYSVFLDKPEVFAEMTATTRVGHHRYTFPATNQANFIIDLKHRDPVIDSWIEFLSDTEIRGMRRSTNWAKDLVWYFHMEFSKPFVRKGIALDDSLVDGLLHGEGKSVKAFVGFNTEAEEAIEVKVSLSAVDSKGALANMHTELPGWGFDHTREKAYEAWNQILGKVRVKGGTRDQTTIFYTALYHAFLQPNTFMDVDGRYRGIDRDIHQSDDFTNYTVFSIWDTYRAWHPMMTILDTALSRDFVRVMLDMYEKGGLLPVWELGGNETYTMIGNHAIPVIADAYVKGIRGFDADKALEAMIHSATRNHYGLDAYRKYGHIPGDMDHEATSKTLEYAFDDWAIAMMAQAMGRDEVYREYIRRAQFYKNIFDPSAGFMRPRMNGGWIVPFDPTTVDWHFTEANSWQYSFYVPQDISGFIHLHGGKEKLAAKIDELFTTDDLITGRDQKDISGLIGQYAHGNEPSHHMAYLYNYVDQPWKTQQRVRQIMDEMYTIHPDGLSGNEDCGQMSAWLIMSAMGFYPVSPGKAEYAIGSPWFPEVEIHLENGNVLRIVAEGVSKQNFYIQSVHHNGSELVRSFLRHEEIMQGGELRFLMGSKPNMEWGKGEGNSPVNAIEDEVLLPVPFIESEDYRIRDSMVVRIGSIEPKSSVFYSLDGSVPDTNDSRYVGLITLRDPATLTAVAYSDELGYSYPVTARFVHIDRSRQIQIMSTPHTNYHGDGPEALIDGLRGPENWRLGGWQGYQGTDFEAVIDLGEEKDLHRLGAGFVQDIRSWIWMPKDVSFSVSSDGEDFKEILNIKNPLPVDDYSLRRHDLVNNVNGRGRYIRIHATNFGTLPEWHLGAGGQTYIFIDEIIIE